MKTKVVPKRIKDEVWKIHFGEVFVHKCFVGWCENDIDVFNFYLGIYQEEFSDKTNILNLRPICRRCKESLKDNITIDKWERLYIKKKNDCCIIL
jgi:hypothetical protein